MVSRIWTNLIWVVRPKWQAALLGLCLYLLSFLLFCLSYRIPGLSLSSENSEDSFAAVVFAPLLSAARWEPVDWIANGFAGRGPRELHVGWLLAFIAVFSCWLGVGSALLGAFFAKTKHQPGE